MKAELTYGKYDVTVRRTYSSDIEPLDSIDVFFWRYCESGGIKIKNSDGSDLRLTTDNPAELEALAYSLLRTAALLREKYK